MDLSSIKGIGPTRLKAIHAAGIFSLRDLLYIRPVSYRDLRNTITIAEAESGHPCCLHLRRCGEPAVSFHGNLSRVTCAFCDDTGKITLCWFNQTWMNAQCKQMSNVTFFGTVKQFARTKQLINPTIVTRADIQPVYRPIEGLSQKMHRSIVQEALSLAEELCPETLPDFVIKRYGLLSCASAIRYLHKPSDMDEVAQAQKRLSFEQILLYQIAVQNAKFHRRPSCSIEITDEEEAFFWKKLSFYPTNAQKRSLHEIAADLKKTTAMARMVQGDVGSGKTAVAMGAMLLCIHHGFQAVLMAPTEILAQQHCRELSAFFDREGYTCGLLTGSLSAKEKKIACQNLSNGTWQAVIGTHALFSEGVCYRQLGLCITDEQHRFGVHQRDALIQKGMAESGFAPHLLVMSATPIPRSLALILYGDLDLSVIDELPPGRQPVATRLVPSEKRSDMYSFIRTALSNGQQAYFVCPLVDSDEDTDSLKAVKGYAQTLQKEIFPDCRVGLSYGSQNAKEKADTLRAFSQGEIQILVATTVIEVGVNVPNATIMVIENADRFGLAQLHQLRGRVGRGSQKSWCFLLSKPNERLHTLCRTNDGFQVAKEDLEQRGPGELLGTLQSGADIWLSGVSADSRILYDATQCAQEILNDPLLSYEKEFLLKQAEITIGRLSGNISVS